VTLAEAAGIVLRIEREVDLLEQRWLGSKKLAPALDEALRRAHLDALNRLHEAVMERDKLRAKLGVHPYMNLVTA
jgi:hypothetical protein